MAPAPTEEGDAIAKVEEVLADLEEQARLSKRHSRSFSEPNLAAKVIKQQLQAAARSAAQDNSSEDGDTLTGYRVSMGRGAALAMHLHASPKGAEALMSPTAQAYLRPGQDSNQEDRSVTQQGR